MLLYMDGNYERVYYPKSIIIERKHFLFHSFDNKTQFKFFEFVISVMKISVYFPGSYTTLVLHIFWGHICHFLQTFYCRKQFSDI